jgi:hypothetical protein
VSVLQCRSNGQNRYEQDVEDIMKRVEANDAGAMYALGIGYRLR